jgi:uncharacterized protein YyaL (SSP411 family)
MTETSPSRKGKNRLAGEKSPYLLQHAENPVDWYPWGKEAFERAAREDRPVFLSIGYSTCHWCHVMAHESFEDPAVAKLMNETFVSVKVDREERPDIDKLYMTVCQMITGSGGWPLTIVMTPDREPFYAATYIPRDGRHGRIGMTELVPRLAEIWRNRKSEALGAASEIVGILEKEAGAADAGPAGVDAFHRAFRSLEGLYDREHGGFWTAPKFPMPHHLLFLLRYWKRTGNENALFMVERTLEAMRLGGIYDHAGGGFHRYSTDERWAVPHFEKMLYDQALLAMAYTEAFQATGAPLFGETAKAVLRYVLREMAAPDGGFCTALDADSEGEEGRFYLWTFEELRRLVPEKDFPFFRSVFAVEEGGNFADEASGIKGGANILFARRERDGSVPLRNLSGEGNARLGILLETLRREREKRVWPHRDDKVLTDWNGLMIAAFAMGGRVFDEETFTRAAREGAAFLLRVLSPSPGKLLHRYREGDRAVDGLLDDYAFLAWGLLELYEAVYDPSFLGEALLLVESAAGLFSDRDRGDFYFTSREGEALPARQKEHTDGAVPSGTAVMILNLVRLGRLLGRTDLLERARAAASALSGSIGGAPVGHTMGLAAMDGLFFPGFEAVASAKRLAGAKEGELLRAVRTRYLPHGLFLFNSPEAPFRDLAALAPRVAGMAVPEEGTLLYPCSREACRPPLRTLPELDAFLEGEGSAKLPVPDGG